MTAPLMLKPQENGHAEALPGRHPPRRSAELQVLARFHDVTREARGLEMLLDEALRFIVDVFGACWASIHLGEGDALRPRAVHGPGEPAQAHEEALTVGTEAARRVLQARSPLMQEDATRLPGGTGRTRSVLAVPLRTREHLAGVLCLGTPAPRAFRPDEALLLGLMADRLAISIEDERAHLADQRARAQLEAVRVAALLLAEPIDLPSALQRIVEQARAIAHADYAALGIVSTSTPATFAPWVFSGLTEAQAACIGRHPMPVGLLGEVPATGVPVRLEQIREDHRFRGFPAHHPQMHAFLGMPITIAGRRVGNLYLGRNPGAGSFSEEDERAVFLLAQHAAMAVESARVHDLTLSDMEALRRTHAALQESEERLRRTFEDAPIGMAMTELDGRYLRVNRALCQIVDRAPGELLAMRFQDITHPEDLEPERAETERLLRGEVDRLEFTKRFLRPDGSVVEVRQGRSLVRDEHGRPQHFIAQMQDVTEHNRIEREMLQSERRFRALFDNASEGILILDNQGHFQDANPAACALLRTPRATLVGQPCTPLADPAPGSSAQERWRQLLRQGEQKGEASLRTADGRVVEVEYSARAHFMPGQHLAILHDITQRKRAEVALRRSESLLRLVLESLPVGVWIADAQGALIQANPAGQRIWGGARHVGPERLGEYKGWWAHNGQRLGADEWAVLRAVRKGEVSIGEVLHIEAFDGTRKTLLSSAVPVRDPEGKILGGLMVNEDVTERLRAEAELKLLAEASAVLSASLDPGATLRAVARLTVRHLGHGCLIHLVEGGQPRPAAAAHQDEARDALARELLEHPATTQSLLARLQGVIHSGEPVLGEVPQEQLSSHSGDERFQELLRELSPRSYLIVPITARDRVLGALTVVSSCPERRYEKRDLAAAMELALRAALAIENAQLHTQAQHAMQLRKEVLAVVSHDLRNPLGSIALRLLALERRSARNKDEATVADAQVLQRSAQQMERLIADLLDMASIDAGRLTVVPHPQDVTPLLKEAQELLEPLGESCGVRLEVQLPSPSFTLCCDRVRLIQVLSNLAGNALKFTPAGGSVTVRVTREGEQAVITVQDTGRGIAPDELPNVFDRYWRARSTERATRGVGLGLAIVKGIVEGHGGTIQVESTLGQGTTFTLRLPLDGPPRDSASAVQAAASADPRGLQR